MTNVINSAKLKEALIYSSDEYLEKKRGLFSNLARAKNLRRCAMAIGDENTLAEAEIVSAESAAQETSAQESGVHGTIAVPIAINEMQSQLIGLTLAVLNSSSTYLSLLIVNHLIRGEYTHAVLEVGLSGRRKTKVATLQSSIFLLSTMGNAVNNRENYDYGCQSYSCGIGPGYIEQHSFNKKRAVLSILNTENNDTVRSYASFFEGVINGPRLSEDDYIAIPDFS